jgi:hypothetical protein
MTAAGRDFISVKDQRNVVAAVVSTAGGSAGKSGRRFVFEKPGLGSACVTGYGSKDDVRKLHPVDRLLRRRWQKTPKAWICGGEAAVSFQRVEDNAFHLG